MSEKEKVRKELRKLGVDFLNALKEEVDYCVLLCDANRLCGLIRQVDIYFAYRLIHDLREKGLEKELRDLCDKAGQLKREEEAS